ncbi:MAG: FG-GAP-like repeat-containing protein, partial [Bacteroidota bacterium]
MKNRYLILFIFIFSISKTLSYAQPIISSFSPSSGPVGTVVTLTGTNFNPITANNIVFFGATQAIVNAASTTSLNVTVPVGASFQPISVLDITTGQVDYSALPFNVTFACGGAISSNSFAAPIDSVTGVSPRTVCAADLDGDGKVDLVVGNQGSGTISVFRNTSVSGTISFAPRVDFNPGGIDPFSIEIGDLDGDGRPDIVLVNYNSNAISVFRNISTSGTISLATKIDFVTTFYPMNVSIGDLDGDGKADLAIGCWYLNSVPILRNTSTIGTISFAAKVEIAAGSLPLSVVIGELDGDNKPDLAVLNNSSNNISIYRNTSVSGTISFATRINYGMLDPRSVTIGDLDGDGKSELAVTGRYNSISVLRNTSTIGSVSFAASINFGTGVNPYISCVADMDGDGKPDFVVGNVDDNTVSVLRNQSTIGTLSFAEKVDFVTGGGPYSPSVADIDGDGRPDITTANNFSNNISVFRNQIHISPLMTSANAATICSGDVLSIPLTSDLSAIFTWIATNCTFTIGESLTTQGTNTLSDVITNNTTSAQVVTYTVIPTSSTGCGAGTPQTVIITVNPSPTMNSAIAETICSGESVSVALTSDISASYSWLANDNLNTTGESITVQTTSTLNNIISNNTTAAETVSYAVTPISTSGGCAGTSQTVNVTVNPLPISNAGNDVTICSGIIDSIGSLAVLGNTYSWNSASGLSDSTVSKPGNTIINSGSIPIVTAYTLTTTITSTGCQSSDIAVITVNPQPVLTVTNPAA